MEYSAALATGDEDAAAKKLGHEEAEISEAELVVMVVEELADAADCELNQVPVQGEAGVDFAGNESAVDGNVIAVEATVAVEEAGCQVVDEFVDLDGVPAVAALKEHVDAGLAQVA